MPKIQTQSTFKTTLTIDDVEIDVRVKRMTNIEYDAFQEGFARWSTPRGTEETPDAYQAREAASGVWMREALDTYLSIVPGELEHDGREITKGGDLLDIFGGRVDVVPQAFVTVMVENRMTEAQKKTSRLALASRLGLSNELPQKDIGDGPAPTAASAEPSVSAPAEAATESPSDGLSGTTDPLP